VTLGDATTTGTLAITQNITSARTVTLNAGGGIFALFGETLTLSGQVTGSGGFTVASPGSVFLRNATNNYSGGTTIASGSVIAGAANVFGTGAIAIKAAGLLDLNNNSQSIPSLSDGGDVHGGAIRNSDAGTAVLTIGSDNSNSAFSGVIEEGISVTKAGTGTLVLSGANTYTGGTTIDAGILQVGVDTVGSHGAITSSAIGTGALTLDGGTLQFGGAYTIANDIALGTSSGTIDANGYFVQLRGDITGSTGITFADSGAGRSFTVLSGNNTYSGTTTIASGTVDLASATALSANSDYDVIDGGAAGGAGELDMNGFSGTIRSLAGNAGGQIYNGGADATLTIAPASGTTTFAGTIADAGAGHALTLVMNGAPGSKEILSGANTYAGGTTISGGILGVGSNTALGTGTVTLNSGTLQAEGVYVVANAIDIDANGGTIDANDKALYLNGGIGNGTNGNTGTLTFADMSGLNTGVIVLESASTYSGAVVIDSGVAVGEGGGNMLPGGAYTVNGTLYSLGPQTISSLTGSGRVVGLYGGGPLSVNQASGTSTFSGTLDDDGLNPLSLVKNGAGTLNLSGTNTFTGGTTLNAGTLGALNSSALGTGGVTLNGGTLVYGNTVNIANAITLAGDAALEVDGTDSATQSGVIDDNGSAHTLQKLGSGTLTLSGANTYSGTTQLTAGTLEIGNAAALGSSTLLFDGGTLKAGSGYTIANAIDIDATGGTIDANGHSLYLYGAIGNGTNGNTGTLTFADMSGANTGVIGLESASTYSGAVVIGSGVTVAEGGANMLPGGAYTVNGTLDIIGAQTISGLTGSGSVVGYFGGGLLSVNQASGTSTFSGTLDDNGLSPIVLEKSGAGIMNLSGANTFTGGTILDAGTIGALNSAALGTGGITFNGGTLLYANTVNIANAITLAGDAALEVDGADSAIQSGAIGDAGSARTLQKLGTGTLQLTQANTYSGTTKLTAGTLEIGDAGGLGSSTLLFDGGTLKVDGAYTIANDIDLDANGGTFDTNGYDTDLTGTLSSGSTDGALTIAGTGSFKVSGLNNLSGGAVLDANAQMEVAGASGMGAGDVSMNAGSAIHFTTTSGTFTNRFLLDGTASFDVDSGLTTTLNNAIADAPSAGSPGVLVKTGAGTLALSGANTYSGGTILTDGILRLDAGTDSNGVSPLGTGTVTFNGGTLQAGGDYTYANSLNETGGGTIDANGHQLSLTGSIVGSTNLTFADSQGGGAVAVTGHNFFNGNVTIDHATVILTGINSGTGVGPLGIGTTTLDGGTLLSEQSGFIDNQIALGADGGTLRATEPNGFGFGPISDAVAGAGPLTIGAPGDTGVVSLSDGSTYTGGTIIAGGTLRALGGTSVLGDASGTVEMKSGTTLDLENATVVANTLILDDTTPTLEVSGGTSTINGGVQELSGTPGGFTKTGTGTLVLAGANNYSGGTSIAAGTLELGSALSVVSAGTYDVASGASLDIDSSLGSVYIGALSGAGSLTAFSGTNLNVGGVGLNSDDTTFSGVINADYLAYDGLGTLTLSGTGSNIKQLMVCGCTNSGGITLSGGSLTAAIGVGVSGQTFTVANGAQLTTPDFEQGGGTVTIMGANTAVDTTNSGAGLIAIYTTVARTPVFTISDGAQVAGDTLLSGLSGGTVAPQITVTGANTLLSLTSGAQLNDGTSLTVVDGATLTAPSIDLDTNATLTIGAGAAAGTVGDASTRIQGLSSGTQLVANFTGNATLDAFITGALGLNLQSGNLTLTNAQNDYSGGTTIASNAVLILQDSPAGTGAIADAGVLAISNSSASTFGYNLSGPGGLAQIGDGALTINTAQVYAGGTVIAPNSTLFLAGAGDLSHSSGIEADGTFDISGVTASSVGITKLFGDGDVEIGSKTLVVAGNGGVFSGILSDGGDHGGLTVLGDQVLNGVISLTGTTTIGAGATLTVSGPNALGGSALDFKAGSTLKFGGSGTYTNTMMFDTGAPVFDVTNQSVTLSGVLDGPGDLAVTGANGTLTLTNTGNTYAGGTEVYGNATLNVGADSELGAVAALQLGDSSTKGTLQYGASFALNNARAITLNAGGSAIDTNGFDATIASTIGGAGGLAKLGTGTLTLTGTNTYSGATTVTAGVLQVNGSIASSAVIVASGGTLSGSGTVGATSVAGTIAPNGNTLHVGGALSLANGATTAIAVTPTTSGQIAATGSASLDGVLAITQGAGTYTGGTSFQLISASSVMGTFDSVTGTSFTGLDSSVVYSATGVELDLATPASSGGSGSGSGAGSGSGSGGGGVVTKFLFGTYGKTANQIAAGKALAAGDPNGALYVAMGNAVKADVAGVPAALGQLSGDIHASVRSAMIEDGRLARDAILDHMQFAEQGTSVWGTGLYSNGGIDSDGNASALHHNSTGFLAGVDMPLGDGFRVGIGAGAISNNASEPGRMSTASGSTGHVLAYGGWSDGTLTLKLGGDYGWGDMDVTRQVAVLPETDKGSRHQSSAQIFSEAAYLFQTDAAQIRPYADLAYISVRTGAFTEKGGVSALSGGARDDDATYATLGVRFSLAEVKLDDTRIVPKLGIGWQHAFDRFSPEQVLTLQNAAQDFTVQGVPLKSDAAVVQAGIGIVLSPDVVLDVGYDGAFSAASRDHGLRGELRWTF
jgi:autotransporter-associated beta strand protein